MLTLKIGRPYRIAEGWVVAHKLADSSPDARTVALLVEPIEGGPRRWLLTVPFVGPGPWAEWKEG